MTKESNSNIVYVFFVLFVGIMGGAGLYNIFLEPNHLTDARNDAQKAGFDEGWGKGESKGYLEGRNYSIASCEDKISALDSCEKKYDSLSRSFYDDIQSSVKYYAEKFHVCEGELNVCRQDMNFAECRLTILNGQHCINSNLLRCSELGGIE